MTGRLGERITVGCPEQEKIKRIIKQQKMEDMKSGATQRHP